MKYQLKILSLQWFFIVGFIFQINPSFSDNIQSSTEDNALYARGGGHGGRGGHRGRGGHGGKSRGHHGQHKRDRGHEHRRDFRRHGHHVNRHGHHRWRHRNYDRFHHRYRNYWGRDFWRGYANRIWAPNFIWPSYGVFNTFLASELTVLPQLGLPASQVAELTNEIARLQAQLQAQNNNAAINDAVLQKQIAALIERLLNVDPNFNPQAIFGSNFALEELESEY